MLNIRKIFTVICILYTFAACLNIIVGRIMEKKTILTLSHAEVSLVNHPVFGYVVAEHASKTPVTISSTTIHAYQNDEPEFVVFSKSTYSSDKAMHQNDEIIATNHREMTFNLSSMKYSTHRNGVEMFGKEFNISREFLERVNFPIKAFETLRYETMATFEVVTSVSDNHVIELTGLIASVQKYLPHKILHVYNIGLSDENIRMISSLCGVTVVPFDFSKYPEHVRDLRTYAFKPAVLHDALSKYPAVFYVDGCQEFTTSDLTAVFRLVFNITRGYTAFVKTGHTINAYTHPDMYKYFITDVHQMKHLIMVEAGSVLIYRTKLMYEMFTAWFLCAMDIDCIMPVGSQADCGDVGIQERAVARDGENKLRCHRYDQSALNLAIVRSYGYKENRALMHAAVDIAPLRCMRDRRLIVTLRNNSTECRSRST